MKSIVIIIPYFGKWPVWMDFFVESCRYNPTIDWLFYTDCGVPIKFPSNMKFYEMSFQEYKNLLCKSLNISTDNMTPYKLCDYKPTYGFVHNADIQRYDFYGFGDIDLIYGNIRKFITDDVLKYDVVSTHNDRLSGHFVLFRNSEKYRNAFLKIPDWRQLLESPQHIGVDEGEFSKLFRRRKNASKFFFLLLWLISPLHRRTYFKEQYTTILTPIKWVDGSMKHPTRWYWKRGCLTNEKDDGREFLYLHFMNYKSDLWLEESLKPAKWSLVDEIVTEAYTSKWDGFVIDESGFHAFNNGLEEGVNCEAQIY